MPLVSAPLASTQPAAITTSGHKLGVTTSLTRRVAITQNAAVTRQKVVLVAPALALLEPAYDAREAVLGLVAGFAECGWCRHSNLRSMRAFVEYRVNKAVGNRGHIINCLDVLARLATVLTSAIFATSLPATEIEPTISPRRQGYTRTCCRWLEMDAERPNICNTTTGSCLPFLARDQQPYCPTFPTHPSQCPQHITACAAIKMDSARLTRSSAACIPRSPTTSKTAMDTLKSVNSAIVQMLRTTMKTTMETKMKVAVEAAMESKQVENEAKLHVGIDGVRAVSQIAKGGYNSIWLVELCECFEISLNINTEVEGVSPPKNFSVERYVLRLPCEDALLPNQITNEVAFKKFVATRLPHIPVPQVYFYHATTEPSDSFIAEEYISAKPLSSTWMSLATTQKDSLVAQLASITVDLAEIRFPTIGGLDPVYLTPAPTVEGSKLFKGRHRFHSYEYYPIGPYSTTKEYILACYDREIAYYTHASIDDIDIDLFLDTSVSDFVTQLRNKRTELSAADIHEEPFVLVHGDFHGRNILAQEDQILAIIDWEFAGSYPLSETLAGGGIDVVDADSKETDEENTMWGRKIRGLIREEVGRRGWEEERIGLLMGDGNWELGRAREEMFP
ncbi:hypothetical protein V494_06376 [Pseudogymnoascus sp. VKM F-4513 (FW-928)]|nr:hypothetical protein V494_06376 [Pseudogymnoascus sp. VKM F-4513 (FW-928)]